MLFNFFSYFGITVPSKKQKWFVFKLIVEALEHRNIISDKLASWCVHVDDADNIFRIWNEFEFDGNFQNWMALVWFAILLNFQT